jgi:D-xylose transport system substrate-binding protein
MTVYKPIKTLAEAAAAAACDLATGKSVDTATFSGKENNGTADIPTQIIPVVPVTVDGAISGTKSIMDSVVADGFYKVTDICTADFASVCAAAGIK